VRAWGKTGETAEDCSSWNLMMEEAQKLKMTPEQFLKRMITDYLKRKDK